MRAVDKESPALVRSVSELGTENVWVVVNWLTEPRSTR